MFKDYNQWASIYHGVDISSKTIQLLEEFVEDVATHSRDFSHERFT